MKVPGCSHVYPLTMRWYLALWRGGPLAHLSFVRTLKGDRTRPIGMIVGLFGLAVGIGLYRNPPGTTRGWWGDFGRRFGRYTIGSWRTLRPVPFSTGWVRGGGRHRIGICVTVASRTFAVAQLATRAEWRKTLAREEARKAR
jgi:hypothetical protein